MSVVCVCSTNARDLNAVDHEPFRDIAAVNRYVWLSVCLSVAVA